MQISFFEEFPTAENLAKIKYLRWPTKLYVAATSLINFEAIRQNIRNKNVTQMIYWPTLSQKEGYWISPFAERKALLRIFEELQGKKIPLMLDLEMPSFKRLGLYAQSFSDFKGNKLLIKHFISNYQAPIYLAEYYHEGKWKEKMLKWWGLHYDHDNVIVIKMMYHSMHNFSEMAIRKECQWGLHNYGKKFCLALGTIAKGINGNEPLLSGLQLKHDLNIANSSGVAESIIFRLGGLDQTYQKNIFQVLKKRYTKNPIPLL